MKWLVCWSYNPVLGARPISSWPRSCRAASCAAPQRRSKRGSVKRRRGVAASRHQDFSCFLGVLDGFDIFWWVESWNYGKWWLNSCWSWLCMVYLPEISLTKAMNWFFLGASAAAKCPNPRYFDEALWPGLGSPCDDGPGQQGHLGAVACTVLHRPGRKMLWSSSWRACSVSWDWRARTVSRWPIQWHWGGSKVGQPGYFIFKFAQAALRCSSPWTVSKA